MGSEVSKESEVHAHRDPAEVVAPAKPEALTHKKTEGVERPDQKTSEGSHTANSGAPRSPQSMSNDICRRPETGRPGLPRQKDRYSPPRRFISPPPIRRDTTSERLRDPPEQHNHPFGKAAVQRHSSPVLPDRAHPTRSPRSPLQHQSPPRGHLSPTRRTSSLAGFQRSDEQFDAPYPSGNTGTAIRNLVWQAPGYHSSAKSRSSLDLGDRRASGQHSPEKIKYNGLTGVPTGPKSVVSRQIDGGPSDRSTTATAPAVIELAHNRPHIFIPALHCPTLPTTRKHLAKFLKLGEQRIHRDPDRGWRIVFEDSSRGRDQLEQFFQEYHLQKLFSMYVLNMQCFPNGDEDATALDDNQDRPATSERNIGVPAGSHEDNTELKSLDKSLQRLAEKPTALPMYAPPPEPNTFHSGPVDANLLRGTMTSTPAFSSPAVTRADKDDSSSISARTASDTSGTKPAKCHVCQAGSLSSLEPLVHCTTCSRKYHRRCCQSKETVPRTSDGFGTWQCKRCLRKQVPPGSRLFTGSLLAGSPTLSTDHHPQRNGTTSSEEQGVNGPMAPVLSNLQADILVSEEQKVQAPPKEHVSHLSEADDLVEKSFAEDEIDKVQPKKTGRLALVRKKLEPAKTASRNLESQAQLTPVPKNAMHDEESRSEKHRLDDHDEEIVPRKKMALEAAERATHAANITNGTQKTGKVATASATKHSVNGNVSGTDEEANLDYPNESNAKPKSKLRPISPHLRTHAPTDSSGQKRMPHELAGTGANRDIIQGGYKSFFDREVPGSRARQDLDALDAEDTRDERLVDVEALLSVQQAAREQKSPLSAPSLVPDESAISAKTHELQKTLGPAVKRQKLANAATRPCASCQRTIPLNPSGSNIYCLKCKRETTESSASHGLGSAAAASSMAIAQDLLKHAATALADEAVDQRLPDGHHHEDRGLNGPRTTTASGQDEVESAIVNDAPSFPSTGKIQRVHQRTACEACRVNHKRCIHRAESGSFSTNEEVGTPDETDIYTMQQTPTQGRANSLGKSQEAVADHAAAGLSESEGDDEDLSSEGAEATTNARTRTVKKRNFRVVAKDEYDLGNGFERPKNTYPKLVGIALCAHEGLCMNSRDIVPWIAAHIPGYDLNEGNNWETGISATISQYRYKPPEEKQICKTPFWYTEGYDPTNKAKGSIVQMMPGVEELMPLWDPALKTPVSPMKRDRSTPVSNVRESRGGHKRSRKRHRESHLQRDLPDLPAASLGTALSNDPDRHMAVSQSHKDMDMKDVQDRANVILDDPQRASTQMGTQESSDDEPLSRRRQPRHFGASSDKEEEPVMAARERLMAISRGTSDRDVDHVEPNTFRTLDTKMGDVTPRASFAVESSGSTPAQKHASSAIRPSRAADVHIYTDDVRAMEDSFAQKIKWDSENVDYNALSLFEEWPEYSPAEESFNKAARIAEIQTRPRRKQRFRMPLARDPWADPRLAYTFPADGSRQSSASFERLTRTPNKTQRIFDSWQFENAESDETVCETWQEFFDMPTNPVPLLHDGQLAYRDGTQNDGGMLRRAKVIFKTGYA